MVTCLFRGIPAGIILAGAAPAVAPMGYAIIIERY